MRKLVPLALLLLVLASVASASPKAPAGVTLKVRGPIYSLAADGRRAVIVFNPPGTCGRIAVWEPPSHSFVPFRPLIGGCDNGRFGGLGGVALAGGRVGWLETSGGMTLETTLGSATLGRRSTVDLGEASLPDACCDGDDLVGPVGDGNLLAFTLEVRCATADDGGDPPCPPGRETGDVSDATIWRAARHGRCPQAINFRPGHCARVAHANGQLTVLSADAGRIAAQTDHGVRLLTRGGARVRDLPVEDVRAAALSGNQLALRVPGSLQVYDTGTGELLKTFPVGGSARLDRLEDLDHGIVVTAMGRTVTLRRVGDSRTATIRARGVAHAQLEPSGLFVAGARRVTFTPMRQVQGLFRAGAGGR